MGLTDQFIEILRLVSHGYSNREIGRQLELTEHTIKSHLRKIFDEIGAVDRAHAVRIAFEEGVLGTEERRERPWVATTRVLRNQLRELVDGRWVAVKAPVHGRYTTYSNWGCRCEPCSVANREQQASYRTRTAVKS